MKSKLIKEGEPYVLTYITDIGFTEDNLKTIKNKMSSSQHLIIECSFKVDDLNRAVRKAHLTSRQAALIASILSCSSFEPFHVSSIYDEPSEVVDEARDFFEEFRRLSPEKLSVELLSELQSVSQCRSDLGGVWTILSVSFWRLVKLVEHLVKLSKKIEILNLQNAFFV